MTNGGGANFAPSVILRSGVDEGSALFEEKILRFAQDDNRSFSSQCFKFFESPRPILLEQMRKGTVCEQAAARLATRAVIGFVIGIANALHLGAAARARPSAVIAALDTDARPWQVVATGNPLTGVGSVFTGSWHGDAPGREVLPGYTMRGGMMFTDSARFPCYRLKKIRLFIHSSRISGYHARVLAAPSVG